jgi:hypothetical protein
MEKTGAFVGNGYGGGDGCRGGFLRGALGKWD